MTDKRFTVDSFIDSYEVGLEDPLTNYTMEIRDNGNTMTYKECCNILNQLHEENEQIKHLIDEAIRTERTELGKSVLKQLKEAIE